MLVDTHCHVQMSQFAADRAQVIQAAFDQRVERLVVPGTDVPTSRDAVALAAAYPGRVFAAVGVHPHDATTLDDSALTALREMAASPGVVAIGETGLDFYRNLSPRQSQRDSLVAQLDLARELRLPIILHNRESHADLVTTLRGHAAGVRGVFHCFIGDQTMARDALDLGFWLSFAGPLTYPRNVELAEVAAWAPLDRILIETDCPYLAPQPFRGKRNEPRHVAVIAERLAELRGVPLDAIAASTTANAATLFRLPIQLQEGDASCASTTR